MRPSGLASQFNTGARIAKALTHSNLETTPNPFAWLAFSPVAL